MTEEPQKKDRPVKHFRVGAVKATIWENKMKGKEGKADYSFFTLSLDRSFKKDGEWGSSRSFQKEDIPKAVLALQKSYEWLMCRDEDDSED